MTLNLVAVFDYFLLRIKRSGLGLEASSCFLNFLLSLFASIVNLLALNIYNFFAIILSLVTVFDNFLLRINCLRLDLKALSCKRHQRSSTRTLPCEWLGRWSGTFTLWETRLQAKARQSRMVPSRIPSKPRTTCCGPCSSSTLLDPRPPATGNSLR